MCHAEMKNNDLFLFQVSVVYCTYVTVLDFNVYDRTAFMQHTQT